MSSIIFTLVGLDGEVVPFTSFKIEAAAPDGVYDPEYIVPAPVIITTDAEGVATVELEATTAPYFITRLSGTIDDFIALKFFVPASSLPIQAEMLYVDLAKHQKLHTDRALYALIETKVAMLHALNLFQLNQGVTSVVSVNGQTGIVVLGASDVGATTILSGSGAPSNGSGSDGNYYFNSVNQDIYFKSGGIWAVVGSWAAGGVTAFAVGTWDMTGAVGTAVPVSTLAATVGGTAPNFELTPTAPLAGSIPGSYLALASSSAGVPKTGTGQVFAKVTLPIFDVGDNITAISFLLVNSSATELDIITLLTGGSPVKPIWGINTTVTAPAYDGVSVSQTYANSVEGATGTGPSGWASSDVAYFGFDYDTGNAVIQKNAGSVTQLSALDLTGFPVGDTMKVFVMLGFPSATPTLLDAPIVFSLGTTDGGKTPFTALGDATLPIGAADGLVYEVTAAGRFGGKQAGVGDYAQLYDTTTKIIVTANQDTVATAVADLSRLDGRVTTLETTVSQQKVNDTLSVRTVSAPGTTTLGVTPNAGFIRVSVGAASEAFNIVAATGKVARVLVAPTIDYAATGGDVFTLNGANFDATANGMVLEIFDDEARFNTWMRLLKYPTSGGTPLTITLADAVASNDVAHCTPSVCYLGNAGLTGDLASWYPSGTQFTHYIDLHDQIRVICLTGSAYGITNLAGQGWGLAPGESAIRYRNGIWLKV